jgi:succinate-semialdehyde dehydrogenase/glutarate-semialdehyde dehydrogenase
MAVIEPATGEPMSELLGGSDLEAQAALKSAERAQRTWAATPAAERAAALTAVAEDLRNPEVAEPIAVLISRETGKRIAESRAELGLSAKFFDFFAQAAAELAAASVDVVPGIAHTVIQRPLGVVVAVTPWNFPVSIPARKIAPALAAGCSVLFKPSEIAPASALRFAEVVEAHVPPGAVNTVVGEPSAVLDLWLDNPAVRGLTFTGSTRVGRILAAKTAPNFTRCVLELGGNAPFVILDDADVETAVETLMIAKYRNNGQSCIAANQVWAPHQSLMDITESFLAASNALRLGDPLDEDVTLGPLALPTDSDRIQQLLGSSGGIVIRASSAPNRGHFMLPAVCTEPAATSRIATEEIFGPASVIRGYESLDEVVAATAAGQHGLGGYVVGDPEHAAAVARSLDVGIVGVNNATPNTPQVPFAGLKSSGLGVEGARAGLDAFLTYQTVAVAG